MPSMPSIPNFSLPTLSSLVPKLPPTTSFPVFEQSEGEDDSDTPPSPDAAYATDGSRPQRARRPTTRRPSGSAVFEGENDGPSDLHLDEADENGRSFTHKASRKAATDPHRRALHQSHSHSHAHAHAHSPAHHSSEQRQASGSSAKSHSRVNPLEHAIASAVPNSARQAELEAADRRWAAGPGQGQNGDGAGARPGLGRKQSLSQMGKAMLGSQAVPGELAPVPSSSSGTSSQPEPAHASVPGVGAEPRKAKFSLLSSMRRKKNSHVPRPLSLTSVPDSPSSVPPHSPSAASPVVGSPDRARARDGHKVKLAKVRVSGKKHREFDHLFVAQELSFTHNLPPKASPPLHDGASAHSGAPSHADGPKPVWVTKWSPDGRLFAAGGHGGVVRVWKVLSSAEERAGGGGRGGVMPVFGSAPLIEWRSHEADVLDMCWSKNSNFLLTSSMDSSVRLFHVDRAECLCAFQHLALVTSIAFCPVNDKYFVSGCKC